MRTAKIIYLVPIYKLAYFVLKTDMIVKYHILKGKISHKVQVPILINLLCADVFT
jgi:hypothetical protein